jgi:hypothetical protein
MLISELARIPGSKAIRRNRYDVVIEQWAKPYLERHLALYDVSAPSGGEPIDATTQLFVGVSRYKVY